MLFSGQLLNILLTDEKHLSTSVKILEPSFTNKGLCFQFCRDPKDHLLRSPSLLLQLKNSSQGSCFSGAQSYPTLCNPIDCSMPGLCVHYQLPEFTQTHVHRVSDAIQPSCPLSSPSPAFNLSQHQGRFK